MSRAAEDDAGAPRRCPRGCPVMVWDGPYRYRCGLGAAVGRCAYHGLFATAPIPPAKGDA